VFVTMASVMRIGVGTPGAGLHSLGTWRPSLAPVPFALPAQYAGLEAEAFIGAEARISVIRCFRKWLKDRDWRIAVPRVEPPGMPCFSFSHIKIQTENSYPMWKNSTKKKKAGQATLPLPKKRPRCSLQARRSRGRAPVAVCSKEAAV